MGQSPGVLLFLIGCGGFSNTADVRSPRVSGVQPVESPEPTEGTPPGTPPTSGTPGTTGTAPGSTPGTPSTIDTGGTTGPTTTGPAEACYPGAANDDSVCLDVVSPSPLPVEYEYPEPIYGTSTYEKPIAFLDLSVHDPAENLAPNFVLDEIAQEFKGQYAVVQVHAVASLQAVRDDVGALIVNSGYRNPDYNAGIGGATWSRHMYGDGFDLDPVSVTLDGLSDACLANGAGYTQVYVSHVHCDWRDDALDPVFYGGSLLSASSSSVPFTSAEIVAVGTRLTAPAEGFDEGEPLRRWSAYDASGNLIEVIESTDYEPPADAADVEVEVGGLLIVSVPR